MYNVDGTHNCHGTITDVCKLLVSKGDKTDQQRFYVTALGKDRLILGYPWFRAFSPDIDWPNALLKGPKVKAETLMCGAIQRARQHREQQNAEEINRITMIEICRAELYEQIRQYRKHLKAK